MLEKAWRPKFILRVQSLLWSYDLRAEAASAGLGSEKGNLLSSPSYPILRPTSVFGPFSLLGSKIDLGT